MSDEQMMADERSGDSTPAVSIIIPAFNAASYILDALRSVFAQTFSDYETIVVNDGSPDTSLLEDALEPYMHRIVYIKQENSGPSGARNTAIRRARGQYIALLDSDDVWLPGYLETQMAALRKDPSLELIYADALLVGDSNLAGRTFMEANPSKGSVTFESLLRWECTIITSCTVARRQTLVEAGLFDEAFRHAEDFDLWLRIAHKGAPMGYQPLVLAHHYQHGASLSADEARLLEGEINVYKKLLNLLPLSAAQRQLMRVQMERRTHDLALERGRQELIAGECAKAQLSFGRANELHQSRKLRASLLGLRVAPQLFRYIYIIYQRLISAAKNGRRTSRGEMTQSHETAAQRTVNPPLKPTEYKEVCGR